MTQDERTLGRRLRDYGIARAADHAEREHPTWNDQAFEAFRLYADTIGRDSEFMTEDVRRAAEVTRLPKPPDKRAWGAVATRAVKAGIVVRAGYGPASDPKVHRSINTIWRRAT